MKKGLIALFSIIVVGCLISACSKSETYSDKLKDERKQIKRFMSDSSFVVIDTYPADGVFKKNEFYRDPDTGVYINVVDSGNGTRAVEADLPNVYFRYWDTMSLPTSQSDTVSINEATGIQPLSFTYGRTATYTNTTNSNSTSYFYLSSGITVPLKYVGENAIVRLIVPFSQGSTYQQNFSYKAIFYGYLQYTSIQN